jgi:hypothetical protein
MRHNLDLIGWIIANTENTDTMKVEDALIGLRLLLQTTRGRKQT